MNFPILGTLEYIPWDMISAHENQAIINHGQTLKKLAERGGLDWTEAVAVLEDSDYKRIDMALAKTTVLKLVSGFQNFK